MEELLILYKKALKGENDGRPYNYDQVNVAFLNKQAHFYDSSGKMPLGHYPLPPSEAEFITLVEKENKHVIKLYDNGEYFCFGCQRDYEEPPAKIDKKTGASVCMDCAVGRSSNYPSDHVVDSPFLKGKKRDQNKIDSAISFLQHQGYVVKELIPSFKVVYLLDKVEKISTDYYKTKEEFEKSNSSKVFISFIKELRKEEETIIL